MFRVLGSDDFPPFGKFRMEFPPVENKPADLAEVHLLTGVNGTGKTRLLALLAAFLGQPAPLVKRLQGLDSVISACADRDPDGPPALVLRISAGIFQPSEGDPAFAYWVGSVPAFAYDASAYILDTAVSVMAGLPKPAREGCLSFSRSTDHSAPLLQAIASLKMQAVLDADADARGARPAEIVRQLEDTLGRITGSRFRFRLHTYPQQALRVEWANVEMAFEALPDGLRSIIGWMVDAVVMVDAWLKGKGLLADTEAVFLLDEVESHLHPAWQRRVLPAFQRLFPKAQIFVATHSPFVISSLDHGWIHPLSLEKDGTVKLLQPVAAKGGQSYISAIEDIMGLKEWYGPETEELLGKFRAERDRAYHGDAEAREKAVRLAQELSGRSMELGYMMGQELSQMERQLANARAK
jgi:hypothetical protein